LLFADGGLLAAGAGIAGIRLATFVPWVLLGKLTRWTILLVFFDQTLRVLS
jgi:membrane protein YqaA with SNARE-associated domain